MEGHIHSFETFGTKDGPGIRFVLFVQGCPLRCLYCHNPDTWQREGAKYILTPEETFREIDKVKNFTKGGVTVSGGEPLMQAEFVLELFKICKAHNMHTALDSSGIYLTDKVKELLEYTDLVLLDIKHIHPEKYKRLTTASLAPTLKFMEYLSSIHKSTWIRYVLVPGHSDNEQDLNKWANYVSQFKNIERVDILPFHQMAVHKWAELNLKYKLADVQPPSAAQIETAEAIFRSYGLKF